MSDVVRPGMKNIPNFFPTNYMQPTGYNPWMTGPPPMPGSWMPPWPQASQFPPPHQCVNPGQPLVGHNTENTKSDEYMVDALRRIYSNDDSSIEIERVKVQRRQQPNVVLGPPSLTFSNISQQNFQAFGGDVSKCLVPAAMPPLPPKRRPPPRKHRKNRLNNELVPSQIPGHTYPLPQYCHPGYFPYFPYPYPYPYPFLNYAWPPTTQGMPMDMKVWDSLSSTNKETNSQYLQQRSLPASPNSQRLDSGTTLSTFDSPTPGSGRPHSPEALSQSSQMTASQSTDRGAFKSMAVRENEWMAEMQRNLANIDDSSEAGDRSSFTTAQSDVPSPPVRRNKLKDSAIRSSKPNIKRAELTEADKSKSSLNQAFQNLEQSVDIFNTQVYARPAQIERPESRNSFGRPVRDFPTTTNVTASDGRSSTASFHSTRNTSDIVVAETDSTDIVLATDTATADEEGHEGVMTHGLVGLRQMCASPLQDEEEPLPGEGYKWVLQGRGEVPDVAVEQAANTWLTDISLWRARLVVSLDRGQGLDKQDWATFHLLLQHPLPLQLKLSLLHAPRICAANGDVGAARVRGALLQLARHAQSLLQKEGERPPGWKSISPHAGLPWVPVKGGIEILRLLGFRSRDDGTLKYSRRYSLESSHLARLTLDLLLFADELRLYLTGGHLNPTNVSDLFCPVMSSVSVSPEPLGLQMPCDNPSSFGSSADFISAESTPVNERKVINMKQSNAHYDSDTAQASLHVDYNRQLLEHKSSSEEDVTLHDDKNINNDTIMRSQVDNDTSAKLHPESNNRTSMAFSVGIQSTATSERLSVSTDITSLPDLQSASSLPPSQLSNVTKSVKSTNDSTETASMASSLPPDEASLGKGTEIDKKEDHIYEEIGEIRAQVQKLRTCVSVPNLPPPLPPKSRSGAQDEESIASYSRGDWSTVSSMGGSTGRCRKKRRAPLPPSFLYEEQLKENQSTKEITPSSAVNIGCNETESAVNCAVENNNKKDPNPFYEEIGDARPKLPSTDKNSKREVNPFYHSKLVPSGFVGANPFYEDIKALKSSISKQTSQTENISEDISTSNVLSSTIDLQFDQSDGNSPPVPAARPKRKAPRPPKQTNDASAPEMAATQNSVAPPDEICTAVDLSKSSDVSVNNLTKFPSESELQDIDLHSVKEESLTDVNENAVHMNQLSKNGNQKQRRSSQDVASVSKYQSESKDNDEAQKLPSKTKPLSDIFCNNILTLRNNKANHAVCQTSGSETLCKNKLLKSDSVEALCVTMPVIEDTAKTEKNDHLTTMTLNSSSLEERVSAEATSISEGVTENLRSNSCDESQSGSDPTTVISTDVTLVQPDLSSDPTTVVAIDVEPKKPDLPTDITVATDFESKYLSADPTTVVSADVGVKQSNLFDDQPPVANTDVKLAAIDLSSKVVSLLHKVDETVGDDAAKETAENFTGKAFSVSADNVQETTKNLVIKQNLTFNETVTKVDTIGLENGLLHSEEIAKEINEHQTPANNLPPCEDNKREKKTNNITLQDVPLQIGFVQEEKVDNTKILISSVHEESSWANSTDNLNLSSLPINEANVTKIKDDINGSDSLLCKDSVATRVEDGLADQNHMSEEAAISVVNKINTTQESSLGKILQGSGDSTNNKEILHIPSYVERKSDSKMPHNTALNLIDDIPYIDNNDVRNYKYSTVKVKRPHQLKRTAISPIQFLHKSIPFIDDFTIAEDLSSPPPPPPTSPPHTPPPPLTPPETPHTSPPPSPPPFLITEEVLLTDLPTVTDISKNRLGKISEHLGLDEANSRNKSEDKEDLKPTLIFGDPEAASKCPHRVSSVYYEIPEILDSPPPLPAKPSHLRSASLLQKPPDLPPKSSKVAMRGKLRAPTPTKAAKSPADEEERYEIPDVTKANAATAQQKVSATDCLDDNTSSASPPPDSAKNDYSSPFKPPRRQRFSSLRGPPLPLKASKIRRSSSPTSAQDIFRAAALPAAAAPRTDHTSASQSTPSSPRLATTPKWQPKSPTEKTRKSWPFHFCDCIYANYEANGFDKNKPR